MPIICFFFLLYILPLLSFLAEPKRLPLGVLELLGNLGKLLLEEVHECGIVYI